MKKLFTLLTAVILTASAFAQAPEKMSYQAIVRDAANTFVITQAVGMQISILQGSATGTAVFVETQTPTTNANGLVSIEIGSGTQVSGDFTTLDWANGPYFIKTETDPTGGTTYTITGTSQLLSVPYALHSKTAESITGTITETDPVFGASVANGITALDTAKWNEHTVEIDNSITNEIQTISRIGTTVTLSSAGGSFEDSVNVYSAGSGISISNNIISTTSASGLSIGDTYQGGIIFYLDPSGFHGLIAAPSDIMGGDWHEGGSDLETRAYGSGLYEGKYNTEVIKFVQAVTPGTSAAAICFNLVLDGYEDWYLPSIYELELMNQNIGTGDLLGLGNIANLTADFYWSSSEMSNTFAWMFLPTVLGENGNLGFATYIQKDGGGASLATRPTRAF